MAHEDEVCDMVCEEVCCLILAHGFHEGFGARFRDSAQVVHQFVLRHADARILDCERRVSLIWDNLNKEVWLRFNFIGIGDGFVLDLIQCIRRVRDQLAKKNLFVGISSVDA